MRKFPENKIIIRNENERRQKIRKVSPPPCCCRLKPKWSQEKPKERKINKRSFDHFFIWIHLGFNRRLSAATLQENKINASPRLWQDEFISNLLDQEFYEFKEKISKWKESYSWSNRWQKIPLWVMCRQGPSHEWVIQSWDYNDGLPWRHITATNDWFYVKWRRRS